MRIGDRVQRLRTSYKLTGIIKGKNEFGFLVEFDSPFIDDGGNKYEVATIPENLLCRIR